MSDKISRTFLALLCILSVLSPPRAAATVVPDPSPDTEAQEPTEPQEPQESTEPQEPTEPTPALEDNGEDMAELENPAVAYGLEPSERVVKTFAELKAALGENNGVTTVHLGADIKMGGGININGAKPHVTIDGFDPENPDQLEPFTLTDYDSALFTDTIYVNSSTVSYVHVRGLKIIGKNYYGPFSVQDAAAMSGVTLIFERVDYDGPQLGYHRQGTIYVADCTARLHGGNGICAVQEFSEARELIFEGENTIESATSTNTIFWHPLGGSFTLADDSSLTLTSPNTSGVFGMFYADGSAYKIDITVGRRSVFEASILNSVAPPANVTLSGITVLEGGEFSLTTTGAANRAVLSVGGDITVEPDAAFRIHSQGGSYPALNLRTGDITVGKDAAFHIISSNTNSTLLDLSGNSLVCDDPASILLYNPGNRIILATTTPGKIYIDAEQVNFRDTASTGGLDDPPVYQWKKSDGTNIRIEGTLAVGTGGNLGGVSSNYAPGDSPGTPPDGTALDLRTARSLAFGRLELEVGAPAAFSTEIIGVTAPGADVRATIHRQGASHTLPDALADQDGVFVIIADEPLQQLDEIAIVCAHQHLTTARTVTVGATDTLAFTVPGELRFYTAELSAKPQIVKRLHENWHILVSDSRGAGHTWDIYVRELQPLTPADSSKPPLKNSLVFVEDTGTAIALGSSGALRVYSHTTVRDSETVNISWDSARGILAWIPTGAAYSNMTYAGILEWSLTDAP